MFWTKEHVMGSWMPSSSASQLLMSLLMEASFSSYVILHLFLGRPLALAIFAVCSFTRPRNFESCRYDFPLAGMSPQIPKSQVTLRNPLTMRLLNCVPRKVTRGT